jgi:hypothetical protein
LVRRRRIRRSSGIGGEDHRTTEGIQEGRKILGGGRAQPEKAGLGGTALLVGIDKS